VSDATNWLRFIGRLKEPESSPAPYADLVLEFTSFLEHERGQSPATIRRRRCDALSFLTWLEQEHRPLSEVTILDVERFLALPKLCGRWTREFATTKRLTGSAPHNCQDNINVPYLVCAFYFGLWTNCYPRFFSTFFASFTKLLTRSLAA
jgi:hypothetical protein